MGIMEEAQNQCANRHIKACSVCLDCRDGDG
jgi:hypothetical protein